MLRHSERRRFPALPPVGGIGLVLLAALRIRRAAAFVAAVRVFRAGGLGIMLAVAGGLADDRGQRRCEQRAYRLQRLLVLFAERHMRVAEEDQRRQRFSEIRAVDREELLVAEELLLGRSEL